MKNALALCFGGVLAVAGSQSLAGGEMKLRTAAQIGSAPKFDVPSSGAHAVTGICVDIFRAMETAQPGLTIVGDQNWLPAVRIEAQIEDGSLDIACAISRSQEDERRFVFIEPSLFAFDFKLVARTDDVVDIRGWDDVRKLTSDNVILVNHGWAYASRLASVPGLHIDDSGPTPDVNLKKLVRSRGRFFYFRSPGLEQSIRASELCDEVRILPVVLEHAEAYLIASRHLPSSTITQLTQVVKTLQAKGEITRILAEGHEGTGSDGCPSTESNADAVAPHR